MRLGISYAAERDVVFLEKRVFAVLPVPLRSVRVPNKSID